MRLVKVTWLDAHAGMDFVDKKDLDEKHQPRVVESVGWLYRKDDAGITIVGCSDNEESFDRQLFVPACMIQNVTVFGAGRTWVG